MEKVTIKTYSFNELSDSAKQVAIGNYNYFQFDSILDNCGLFYINGKPIVENTRKNIHFSLDREWFISCSEAMYITNENEFLKELGCSESLLDKVYFAIKEPYGRYSSTIIEIEENEVGYEFTDEENAIVKSIEENFDKYIDSILTRLENDYNYMLSDEFIENEIVELDIAFTEDGKIFNY